MKLIRKIIFGLIILITVMALGFLILTKSISRDALKDLINSELLTLSSQTPQINGDITWHLLPRPGIKVTQLHIGDEINLIKSTLFIDELLFNLQLKSLLQGHLVFKEIKIEGLNLNFNSDAKPLINFDKLTKVPRTAEKPARLQFAIDRLVIAQGTIIITQQQQKITLTDFYMDAKGPQFNNEFFPLNIKTNLKTTLSNNKINAGLHYEGQISLDALLFSDPLLALQRTKIEGELLAKNLQLNQFKIDELKTMPSIREGALILSPLNLSLYGGKSVGDLSYQFASSTLSINQTANDLNANQFFNAIFDKKLIKGHLDTSIHATSNLQNDNWLNNFTGKGQLTIKNGTLYFIDLQKLVNEASIKIHAIQHQDNQDIKQALTDPILKPTDSEKGTTKFQLLNLQYRLLNRRMMNDSLLLQTFNLELKGQAQVNLDDARLNGHLSAKLVTADNMLDKLQQLLGGSFPLIISGKITAPEISPNAREINPVITRYMLQNVLGIPVTQVKDLLQSVISIPDLLFSNER